jgi:hemolysin III
MVGSAVLITLVAAGESNGWQLAGAIVFCIALVLVYTSSTLYHSIPHVATKRRMKIFDHCAIFVLIAGTYTPFALVDLRDSGGWWLFGAAWTIAAIGVVLKLFLTGRFKGISTIVYVAMGWMALLGIKPMLAKVPMPTLLWLLAGGLAYTLGTLFYMSKRRHAHAIWHGFVLLGSTCHFVAVAMQVL